MKIIASTALDHLRVLDLTRVRAGPTCCRILADFGADVIKIDAPPGLDPNEGISGARHGYDMVNLHRNKRSITLNLKAPEGREVFMRMLATADVVVENFRPDVKERMRLDYESLEAVNPRIILASISGFGQTGPYKTRPGFDLDHVGTKIRQDATAGRPGTHAGQIKDAQMGQRRRGDRPRHDAVSSCGRRSATAVGARPCHSVLL